MKNKINDENETKINIKPKIDIKPKITDLEKLESGVFRHPEYGKLLYKPDEEFEVKTCCNQTTSCDKSLMEFLAKTVVSLSVLGFCFIQLSQGRGDSSYLSSTVSLVLGTYLGSTVSNNNNNNDKRK